MEEVVHRVLGAGERYESLEPCRERVGGRSAGEQRIGFAELSDLVGVHRRDERLAGGEVAVQGADADTGVLGQGAHRRIRCGVGEELPGALEQSLAVAIGVGPHEHSL